MDTALELTKIPIRIIKEQELVIGPLAWAEAQKVDGLSINQAHTEASLTGDAKDVINRLVARYERLFGKTSLEVCKEAIKDIATRIPAADLPESLR